MQIPKSTTSTQQASMHQARIKQAASYSSKIVFTPGTQEVATNQPSSEHQAVPNMNVPSMHHAPSKHLEFNHIKITLLLHVEFKA